MTGWYLALLACILVAVGVFVLVRLRADLVGATDRALRPALGQIALGYRNEGFPEFHDQSATVLGQERAASQVLTPEGAVLRTYGDPISARAMVDRARLDRTLADVQRAEIACNRHLEQALERVLRMRSA
jgi:hypothetical protein